MLAKWPLAASGMADAPAQLQCHRSVPNMGCSCRNQLCCACANSPQPAQMRQGVELHAHLDAFRLVRRCCRMQQAATPLHGVHCIHVAAWAVQPVDQGAQGTCTAGPGQGRRRRGRQAGDRAQAGQRAGGGHGPVANTFSYPFQHGRALRGRVRAASGDHLRAPAWHRAQGSRASLLAIQPIYRVRLAAVHGRGSCCSARHGRGLCRTLSSAECARRTDRECTGIANSRLHRGQENPGALARRRRCDRRIMLGAAFSPALAIHRTRNGHRLGLLITKWQSNWKGDCRR